jgi:hypothetical protein
MGLKLLDLFKSKSTSNKLSLEDKTCYERLSKILIMRETIKKLVMTQPYNVSIIQMVKYLKEHFIKLDNPNSGKK